MKNWYLLIAVLFLFSSVYAQGKIKEGLIQMELTQVESDDPNAAGFLEGMRGSTQDIYFSEKKQKTVMNMMGGLVSTTVITDTEKKEVRTYMDMMGQKLLIKSVLGDDEGSDDVEIIIDPTKTKTINGYKCKLATIIPKDDSEQDVKMEIYFTEDIALIGSISNQINTKGINGAPLEMSINAQGFKMKYETRKVVTSLGKDAFSEPKGHKEISQAEFEKMMGGFSF
jgi:hypothetical protein